MSAFDPKQTFWHERALQTPRKRLRSLMSLRRLLVIIWPMFLAACVTASPDEPIHSAQVGVAFDRKGEIAAFASGLADSRSGRRVTPDDPVRVASISKMVTAIGVMTLVDNGKLDLESDVSRWLGWRLRNPYFPDRPITLGMLLSHTGSVREHDDDYAIPLGHTLQALMQDPGNWDPQHGPGDHYFRYTNLNYPIVASALESVTRERFDMWMRRILFEPMGIDACFNWTTCSDARIARAVELDVAGIPQKDDLHGQRPACPVLLKAPTACDLSAWRAGENGSLFAPQGGLRISARDLAKVARMLLNDGVLDGKRILSRQAVQTLLAQRWHYEGSNGVTDQGFYCSYGYAIQQLARRVPGCRDAILPGRTSLLGHAGDAYGLKSGVWIDPARGVGIVYFVTGVPVNAPKSGAGAFTSAEARAFRRTYSLVAHRH